MWSSEVKLSILYRGHKQVYKTKKYKIFLDKNGTDHYQSSAENMHRKVRNYNGKWQFNSSGGWKNYSPKIQSKIKGINLKKRKSNTIPDWWSDLYQKIKASKTYCYLRSRGAGPSRIEAFCSTKVYKNRNPNLDPRRIRFEEKKYMSGEYNDFRSSSGNLLLVPPMDIGATDIKDFTHRYGISDWHILYEEIMKRWKSGMWVDTEGHAVPYLHVRFEQTPLYKPLPTHTRL